MKNLVSMVGVAAIAGAILLGNTMSAAAENISAQQFVDAVVGNTQFGKADNGVRFKALWTSNGRVVLNMENRFSDKGRWEVKDGKLCQEWEKIRGGNYFCLRDFALDGDLYTYFNEATDERQGPYRIHKGTAAGYEDVK